MTASGLEHLRLDIPSHIGLFFVLLVIGLFLVSVVELSHEPGEGGLALPTFLLAPVLGITGANTLTRTVRQRCLRAGDVPARLQRRYDWANSLLGSLCAMVVVQGVAAVVDGVGARFGGLHHALSWTAGLAMPVSIATCAAYATWRVRQRTWLAGPAACTLWLSAALVVTQSTHQDLGMDPTQPLLAVVAALTGTGLALVARYGWRVPPP